MKNNRLVYLLIAILTVWLLYLTFNTIDTSGNSGSLNVNEYNVTGFSTDFTQTIADVKSTVVTIETDNSISTGFVYAQNGLKTYIVSTYHGVSNANNIIVNFDSSYKVVGNILGYDAYSDVAVIECEIPYEVKTTKLADSSLTKQGEFVICIGTPSSLEYKGSVEMGIVSNNLVTIENQVTYEENIYDYYENLIQLSSNLKQGYSGAPIINMNSEAIGMCLMKADSNTNFVLSANELRIIADKIINGEVYTKTQFGISGTYLSSLANYEKTFLNLSVETTDGLYISKIKENGLGFKFGIRVGDVITSINGFEIATYDDYLNVVYANAETFEISVIRAGEQITLTGSIND